MPRQRQRLSSKSLTTNELPFHLLAYIGYGIRDTGDGVVEWATGLTIPTLTKSNILIQSILVYS